MELGRKMNEFFMLNNLVKFIYAIVKYAAILDVSISQEVFNAF